jgi:hypothetical protein
MFRIEIRPAHPAQHSALRPVDNCVRLRRIPAKAGYRDFTGFPGL